MTATSETLLRAQTSKGSRGFKSHPLRHLLGLPRFLSDRSLAVSCRLEREQNRISRLSPYTARTACSRVVRAAARLAPMENEMTEIPEDVMKAAEAAQDAAMARCKAANFAVYEYPFNTGRAKDVLDEEIARAILAEQDLAAKIADEAAYSRREINGVPALFSYTVDIAAAIRNP